MREPIYKTYGWLFDVDFDEYAPDLKIFNSIQSFFQRPLRYRSTPQSVAKIYFPCDGFLQAHGEIDSNGRMEQIKGVTYDAEKFLGMPIELRSEGTKMYYAVIYLAPGDYHRFHGGADWNVEGRFHFPGDIFPVNNIFARRLPGLFTLNERVVIFGNYDGGRFYSITSVGAFNVGSIRLAFEPDLRTNLEVQDNCAKTHGYGETISNPYPSEERLRVEDPGYLHYYAEEFPVIKSQEMGRFTFGSTIVMAFEVDKEFQLDKEIGSKVRYGETIL